MAISTVFAITAGTAATAAESARFDIHAGRAGTTLYDFSAQARSSVLFDERRIGEMSTNAVAGRLEPAEALTRLLANTGLTFFVKDDGKTFIVVPVPKAADAGDRAGTPASPSGPQRDSTSRRGSESGKPENPVGQQGPVANVDVVGTRIHGSQSVGAQPLILDATDIRDSGATTLREFFDQITENFGGGGANVGLQAQTNSGLGETLNLRGLGPSATLILVDGRRVAPSGTQAALSDVANIPLALVQRIEIYPDGASALYGSDAVAGVVNVVLEHELVGGQTYARVGSVTQGALLEHDFAQLFGLPWGSGRLTLGFEDYRKDPLRAVDRRQASSDLSPRGPNLDTPFSNPGTAVIDGAPWKIPAGQNGTALEFSALTPGQNLEDVALNSDVTPDQHLQSFYAAIDQAVGGPARIFGNFRWTQRHARERLAGDREDVQVQPTSPYYLKAPGVMGPEVVQYDFADVLGPLTTSANVGTLNITGGFSLDFDSQWHGVASVSEARETEHQFSTGYVDFNARQTAVNTPQPGLAFNPFGAGSNVDSATASALQGSHGFDSRSKIDSLDVSADGPLTQLSGGALKIAIGGEYRRQSFHSLVIASGVTNPSTEILGRRSVAAFTELRLPLVGPANALPALRSFDVSLAGRYEHNSDFPHTATPKAGLDWEVIQGLELHATWGRSVRAPNLGDLSERQNISFLYPLNDPRTPGSAQSSLVWVGNNADLHAERATTATFGATVTAASLGGLRLDLTYFDIVFKDRIQSTPFEPAILADPQYQSIVIRNPSPALRQRVCETSNFGGDLSTCLSTPLESIVDLRLQNIQELKTCGMDLSAASGLPSPAGTLSWLIRGTYTFDYALIQTPTSAALSLLNTEDNPINLRLWGSLTWQWRHFESEIDLRYANHYRDSVGVPNRRIASWSTVDLRLSWLPGDTHSLLLKDMELTLNVKNVADRGAPFVVNVAESTGYDQENANLLGRTVSLWLYKRW